MKGNFYICLLVILSALVSCTRKTQADNSRNDSVEKYLKLASIDTLPFEIRKKHNQKAFSFVDLEKNDTVVRWYLCETALNCSTLKDSIGYYKISKLHLGKTIEANDTLNLARFYRYRSGYLKSIYKFLDSSYYYSLKAEKYYSKLSDEKALGVIYYNKGSILTLINDFSGAELEFVKAERIFKKFNNEKNLILLANNYANVYSSLLHGDKALKIYKDGLERIDKYKDKSIKFKKAFLLANIAKVYYTKKQYSLALKYYELAINDPNVKKKDVGLYSYILNGISECKIELKEFEGVKELLDTAVIYSETIQDKENLFYINKSISQLYYLQKNDLKAQKYADEALFYARETNTPYHLINALKQVGIVNKEKAASAIIEYDVQVDSLLNRERRERSKFLKIQLETDEITQEKEKAIKQKWIQTSAITSLLIIAILLFVIYRQRSQKKEFLLIQNQQKANEEIYQLMLSQQSKEEEARQNEKQRIARELHDNVMNQLASTRFNLFSLTQGNKDDKIAKEHIDKIKEVEDEIRNLTHELVSENFSNENGFKQMIQQFINQQNQLHSTDFKLIMHSTINWDNISSEIKMNLYRIIQEAVHNSNKHSEATKVVVQFTYLNNQLDLIIRDNGIGFDQKEIHQGIGLQNMQQRMESVNGKLFISSTPGKGTLIRCVVEVDSKNQS